MGEFARSVNMYSMVLLLNQKFNYPTHLGTSTRPNWLSETWP